MVAFRWEERTGLTLHAGRCCAIVAEPYVASVAFPERSADGLHGVEVLDRSPSG